MEWKALQDRYSLVMSDASIDAGIAADMGKAVEALNEDGESELVGFVIPDGYEYVSAYHSSFNGSVPDTIIRRVCYTMMVLNPEADFNELSHFIMVYCDSLSGNAAYKTSKAFIDSCLEYAIEKDLQVGDLSEIKYFYWVKDLPLDKKRSLVLENYKSTRKLEILRKVGAAISFLMEDGQNKFITAKEVQSVIEDEKIPIRTINDNMGAYREEINKRNTLLYGTSNFNTYRKMISVMEVTRAIKVIGELDERLSQRNVARKSNLHFNTVNKVWGDSKVQSILNKYNKIYNE